MKKHEPIIALDSGNDGLDLIKKGSKNLFDNNFKNIHDIKDYKNNEINSFFRYRENSFRIFQNN